MKMAPERFLILKDPDQALQEVLRRFDKILRLSEGHDQAGSRDEPKQILEWAQEVPESDSHTLGPAKSEERACLDGLAVQESGEMDTRSEVDARSVEKDQDAVKETCSNDRKRLDDAEAESESNHMQDQVTNGPTDLDTIKQGDLPLGIPPSNNSISGTNGVEIKLREWVSPSKTPPNLAALRFSDAAALLHPCEQLRLFLEPSRIMRLIGNFRTRKRLNVKKIILYIASKYTKDLA